MSERAGSVRDARFLSGADVGRVIAFEQGDDLFNLITGTIYSVHHHAHWIDIYLGPGPARQYALHPHDAVTITGADG